MCSVESCGDYGGLGGGLVSGFVSLIGLGVVPRWHAARLPAMRVLMTCIRPRRP